MNSKDNDILIHAESGVMTITFNRVEKKNSISSAMYATMADALVEAEKSSAVRVVVFQGHEAIFSAGNDIGDFLNGPPSTQESPVYRFLNAISTFSKPVLGCRMRASRGHWYNHAISLRFGLRRGQCSVFNAFCQFRFVS